MVASEKGALFQCSIGVILCRSLFIMMLDCSSYVSYLTIAIYLGLRCERYRGLCNCN